MTSPKLCGWCRLPDHADGEHCPHCQLLGGDGSLACDCRAVGARWEEGELPVGFLEACVDSAPPEQRYNCGLQGASHGASTESPGTLGLWDLLKLSVVILGLWSLLGPVGFMLGILCILVGILVVILAEAKRSRNDRL